MSIVVMQKTTRAQYEEELRRRFEALIHLIQGRDLKTPGEGLEGLQGRTWTYPENMCALLGSDMEIRLAVKDFHAILDEVKKVK